MEGKHVTFGHQLVQAVEIALIATVGAWRIDNPEGAVDYARIFPELFKRLSDHFFDERKRQLKRNDLAD